MSPLRIVFLSLVILVRLPLIPSAAGTASLDSLLKKGQQDLEAWRLPQAEEVVSRLLRENPKSLRALDLKTRVDFYQGRYAEALQTVDQAMAIESANEQRLALRLLAQRTHDIVKPLKGYESEHFIIHLDQDKDGILAQPALEALEKSYQAIGEELGFFPRGKVRVEMAPDVGSFNAISTLSLRDIEETGAVGICKFNKVMTISPRVLVHGYRWLDSLSHEYLHYAIVGLTDNQAPIWLHEGIARFYESRWRRQGGSRNPADYLTPASQTLLARALMKNQLIGFERMEPSLINLETPAEVQLAYTEAASAVDFIVSRKGPAGLRRLLSKVRQGTTPQAIERVMGVPFDRFQKQWKEFLRGKGLREVEGSRVRRLKVRKEKGGGEDTVDLKEIRSVVARNRTHLGDRLWARGRMAAAAAEYRRALKASPHSIIILNRLGRTLTEMKRYDEALPFLNHARALDPDYAVTYVRLALLYHAKKNYPEARAALEEALQINPFNPVIYHLMVEVQTALGQMERAENSRALLEKLLR